MESLFPYLLWGGLFFLMMRFGCGSHMFGHRHGDQAQAGHGGHDGGQSHGCCGPSPTASAEGQKGSQTHDIPPAMHRDPVCGKSVATDTAKTSVHAGTVYYFCSRDCREIFEAAPETYLVDSTDNLVRSAIPLIEHQPHADHGDGHAPHR